MQLAILYHYTSAYLYNLANDDFDFDKIKPNGDAVPKSGIIYTLLSGLYFIAIAAAIGAFIGGIIAWVIGPLFGAIHISDRGKAMIWKSCGGTVLVSSATAIIAWLLNQ